MYFLKQDLDPLSFSVVSSFGLLYLKFHSPTPLPCVSTLNWCLSLPFSLLLIPLLCSCTQNKVYLFSALHLSHLPVMVTPPFTLFLFLHDLIEFVAQPHLVDHGSHSQAVISCVRAEMGLCCCKTQCLCCPACLSCPLQLLLAGVTGPAVPRRGSPALHPPC